VRILILAVAAAALAGCGTQAIIVSEAAIADRPDAQVVGWSADEEPRLVFSPEDEEVALHVRFAFNYRGVYEWYKVEWIAPDGSPYKVVSTRTEFGSHRDLRARLRVRGRMASRMPGVWRVRLWLIGREDAPDRLLVSRLFRIAEPSEAMRAAGLTPVDEPPSGAERPLAAARPGRPAGAGAQPAGPERATDARVASVTLRSDTGSDPALPRADARTASAAARPGRDPGAVMLRSDPGAEPAMPAAGAGAEPPAGAPAARAEAAAAATRAGSAAQAAGVASAAPAAGVESAAAAAERPDPVPAAGRSDPAARLRREYPGCPPLYYPPGPGCVEQAPQE